MIALPNQGCSVDVLPLIRTLFDIVILRKGPEEIPRSVLLLLAVIGLWVFASLAALALITQIDEPDFFLQIFSGIVGVLCYAAVVVVSGRGARLLQTITAILGCGALITFVYVADYVLVLQLVGLELATVSASMIGFWSVFVEGHVIARAIDRVWYIGVLIAIAVYVFQFAIFSVMSSTS